MKPTSDLIIVGAGLIGLSCAIAARERGMDVVLIEAGTVGRQASSASAGGVRSLNRHPAEIPLVRAALPLWATLSARLGRDCGFRASGQVRVAEDEIAMAALEARATRVHDLGHRHERLLSSGELANRVPGIAPHCRGALAVEDDGFADPLATVHALREHARRLGVRLIERTRVVGLDDLGQAVVWNAVGPDGPVTYRARHGVNAAGAWGGSLAEMVGDRVPIRTAALQMSVSAPLAHFLAPVLGSEGRKLSLKQTAGGALVIGGGYEGTVGHEASGAAGGRIDPSLLAENLAAAVSLFPQVASGRIVRTWTGLEGMVVDGLPAIGPSGEHPSLVHAFGFSAHGFALVPLIGTLVTDLIEGRASEHDITPLDPRRFAQAGPDRRSHTDSQAERAA